MKKKRIVSLLLSMIVCIAMMPVAVFATENYGLYVNGEQFTSEKLSIACGEGTATYVPETKTLTLNNASITNGGKSDESPKYGIRVVGDTDLTIKLSGTNSIILDNGGGIFADGDSDNYNIIGDGKLEINVKWDALYTLNGDISISEGAELDIKSAEGNGIMSYNKGEICIDSAKVNSLAGYSAANAKTLEVKNKSEVVLKSNQDYFNAAYMGDGKGTGSIDIIDSKVEATSYYPALYTEGNLTINGGEVKGTSTADSAIWTKGDILIKGGAKVTTDGKYSMGGKSITVEEADVDAKNTNESNEPAIYDKCEFVIADGYRLKSAKAVDYEGTEIDLLSSGTQKFSLYKNVHFITAAIYNVSFVVKPDGLANAVIKVDGKEVANPVQLEAGTYNIEVTADGYEPLNKEITITADTATHTQTLELNKKYSGGSYIPKDNVTNNPADKSTTADLIPAVKDNKAETIVDAKTADKIVDRALENKSTKIIIDAAGNNTVASSEVAIPEKTVKELAEKTDANLVIKTDNGKVDLDKTALDAVAAQAGNTGFVRLIIETIKSDENICHVNLKLITSNGAVKDFRGGNVKVTINLDKELAAKELVCVYIDDNGIYTLVEGVLNADGTYTFTTGHFSEYAVMAKDEADKVIAEQLNTLIRKVNLKVRTSKTSKKNIKAVVSGDITALTDAGYTVKYKFYRSANKSSKYAARITKEEAEYLNTEGKKDKKYYYKAKLLIYDNEGNLVAQTELKQCKYGLRTWSK